MAESGVFYHLAKEPSGTEITELFIKYIYEIKGALKQ